MSLKAITLVIDTKFGNRTKKLVMLTLADFADERGRAWPSVDRIAYRAECSIRTAQTTLQDLATDGLVACYKNAGPRATNLYILKFQKIRSLPTFGGSANTTPAEFAPPPATTGPKTAGGGATTGPGIAPEPPERSKNPHGGESTPLPKIIAEGLRAAYPDARPQLSRRERDAAASADLPTDVDFWNALARWNKASDAGRGRPLWPRSRVEFLEHAEEAEEHVRKWARLTSPPPNTRHKFRVQENHRPATKEEIAEIFGTP